MRRARSRRRQEPAPRLPEETVAGSTRGPALLDGRGLAVVVNATAGSGRAEDVPELLAAELPAAVCIAVSDEPLEAAFARAAAAAVLGIVGGDGSINAAAEQALATNRPLAVFPGGTLNHFARDLGVSDAGATVGAVRHGDVVEVDVGLIGGKPFLNTASFGSYAEFVDTRERLEGGFGKWAAMFVAAVIVLWRAKPTAVEVNGERRSLWMIFIGNCAYLPADLAPARRDRLDDGLFDVRYVDGSRRGSRIRLLGALATGPLAVSEVYERVLVRSIDIRSLDGPLRVARDGETNDCGTRVQVVKHRDRLAVYAPRRQS